jgi:threonylcarbamoyladenosine tRNA methylthiotransferase CDKAL1
MAKILSHPRVYSFLHIPVQSGSDTVLGDMKREYNRADFQKVVDFLHERYFKPVLLSKYCIMGCTF